MCIFLNLFTNYKLNKHEEFAHFAEVQHRLRVVSFGVGHSCIGLHGRVRAPAVSLHDGTRRARLSFESGVAFDGAIARVHEVSRRPPRSG